MLDVNQYEFNVKYFYLDSNTNKKELRFLYINNKKKVTKCVINFIIKSIFIMFIRLFFSKTVIVEAIYLIVI